MDIYTGMESRITRGEIQEKLHYQPETEVIFVIKGHIEATVSDKVYILNKNDVIVFNSGLLHGMNVDRDAIICVVCYSYNMLSDIVHKDDCLFYCNSVADDIHSYRNLREIFREIVYQHVVLPHKTQCLLHGLLYKLLDCLVENFLLEESWDSTKANDADARMRQIFKYIEQNFRYNASLSGLAESMYMSASTLSRFFKKQTGVYFAEYINQMRLKYAFRELLYTDNNITRIASDSGFSNLSVFNRTFREHYGMSPTDCRKIKKTDIQKKEKEEQQLLKELREIGGIYPEKQIPSGITVEADVTAGEIYDKKWNKTINVGSMNTLMLANIQYHLVYIVENLGFKYARLWNVFSKKMMITDGIHIGNYNYDKVDMVLDFMVSHKIIPFLDMGARPDTAVRTENIVLYFEDENVQFKSREAWEETVSAFIHHIVQRYGEPETSKWIFELGYDIVHDIRCYEDEDYNYINAFQHLYKTVKEAAPAAQVGGPMGIAGLKSGSVAEFLRQCKNIQCVPDFVSFILFPYRNVEKNGEVKYLRSTEPKMEKETLEEINALLLREGIESKIYISEWNSSISSRNYLNDSCFRAAYIVRTLTQLWDCVDMICVWMASDWVSNYFDTNGIANGGNGLLTKDTICKPAYHALSFMNSLGKYFISKGNNYIITSTDKKSYYILCFNYKQYNYSYYTGDEDINKPEKIDDLFKDNDSIELDIVLTGVEAEKYVIKKRSVSPETGNLLSEWKNFQYDRNLDSKDIKYIRRACYPRMSMEHKAAKDNRIEFHVKLKAHEIILFHIYDARVKSR